MSGRTAALWAEVAGAGAGLLGALADSAEARVALDAACASETVRRDESRLRLLSTVQM